MKCLTVCQPWAHAIIHLGKTVENRGWRTRCRGPLLIHAGASRRYLTEYDFTHEWRRRYGIHLPPLESLAFGAILGVVELTDCVLPAEVAGNPWAEGPWCWLLADPRPLPVPIPYRGRQLLYDVPEAFVHDPAGYLLRGCN